MNEFSFTKEELLEIEKHFDIIAGNHAMDTGRILSTLGSYNKELSQKIFNEFSHSFDVFRTISVKANKMRDEIGKEEK